MSIWNRIRNSRLPKGRSRAAQDRRRRRLVHESLEARDLLAFGDVVIDFKFVNSGGNPVSSLQVGQDFTLQVNVRDGQADPDGVLRAYLDFTYPAALATVRGPIEHGANFSLSASGDATTRGLIDEVGGTDTNAAPPDSPGDSFLLFSLPMRAASAGTLTLTANPADGPTRRVALFDLTEVPPNEIQFDNSSIAIAGAGAGINVSPTSGLTTTELGGTAPFSVVLSTQPTANVTINLSSNDLTEGTVSPTSLTFTTANWNTPRTVTVTGVNDAVDDGNVLYTIVTAPAVSTDTRFNGLNPSDVTVTNTNDDIARINVTAAPPLTTSETGTTATFQIVLNSQPTGDVTIPVSSSDTTEGTVSVSSVVFTTQNWNVARTVTVTGVDDAVLDGNINYSIILGAASSSDLKYNGLNPADLAAVNQDAGDTAGFTVQPTSGLTTTEAGGTATFRLRLNAQPTGNVTIGLSSSDATEGTVSPSSVTFTSANWNVLQTVTVTGVNDDVADGNVAYSIITAAATGAAGYAGLNPADVGVSNTDNDQPGFTIAPTSGLITSEAGQTATFTVRLNSRPTANVVLPLSSSDSTEGTAGPSSLTFTIDNWNVAQTVTATGVNDNVRDGNIVYSIVTAAATSSDLAYNGVNPTDVSVTNTDDDVVGVTVSPTSGLTTTEAGGTATFTVRLQSQPTANVTIPLSSNHVAEGTVSPASLTFTSQNWNVNQTVTATGVNDFRDDGNVLYLIVTGATVSSDSNYSGVIAADVSVTNLNDDNAEILVTAPATLMTSEAGTTATFQLVLKSEPTANVTIPISSSDATEGTVSVASVTFTPQNWNVSRTITVTGIDDSLIDGNVSYSIVIGAASSSDLKYNGRNPADLPAINQDLDTPGFLVQPTSGLMTTETGGTATFQIRLTSQPAANVSLGLSSSDATEGTVSPSSVTFTPANWNVLQTVTVTGVDDDVADGGVAYSIITGAATGDAAYAGLNPVDVSVTNLNVGDAPGFTFSPTSGLATSEAGQTATLNIRLTSQPTANVTLPLSTSDATEGTISPASVTFTPQNWNVNQPITVTGVNDDIDDGSVAYEIITGAATSSDGSYSGLNPANVSASNADDTDTASIVAAPTTGLTTSELGGTATFTVRLGSQPTTNVQIQLSSSDSTEGTVSPSMLTFTPANWNVNQNVTVTGVNDNVHDGNISYTIAAAATSVDTAYNSLVPRSVSVTNSDDDVVGVLVDPVAGLTTTETGGTAQFTVRLRSEPTANVTIPLSSNDATEGSVSPASLTFTNQNWNVPQVVTVTGASDFRADGDIVYLIVTAPAVSTDADYNGFNAVDVAVINNNTGPVAGFNITPTSGLTVAEDGPTSATFQVSLNSQPAANVVVNLSSSDTTEGTISPAGLTFTEQNWNVPQTATVTGVDDPLADGDVPFTIQTSVTSQDSAYSGLNPADVSVVNINDDPLAINVSPAAGLQTDESGTLATFAIMLTSQPTADVTIGLASSNASEGTISLASVTFTTSNWETPQSVTIVGVDDETVDGDQPFTIVTAPAVSSDADYNNFDAPDVSVTNLDDDAATLTLSTMSASQPEGTNGGLTAYVFQLELSRAVAGGFDVGYTTNDGTATAADGDYIDNDGMLGFEGAKCEIRTITVQANHDNKVEADEMFDVAVGQLTDIPANLAERITFVTPRVTATIANDDTATLLLSPVSTALQEGTGPATTLFAYEVTLSAPVQGGLDISYSADDGSATVADGDYVDNDGTLRFTGTADERQTITVAVNQDSRVETDETFTVALHQLSNLEQPNLADNISIGGTPATATILNDDAATLTITSVTSSQQEGSDGVTTDYAFEVTLSHAVQGGFSVPYTTDDDTATLADGDYIDNDGVLTFLGTANEVQTITVRVNQDLRIELDEAFHVTLGQLSGTSPAIAERISIGGSPATATILNDDFPRLVLAAVDPALAEGTGGDGATFTYTVTLSDDVADPDGFDVAFATADGTATAASGDFTANSGMLHFAGTAGEMKTITVAGLSDTIVEAAETFEFALGDITGLEPGIMVRKTGTPATATLLNDDVTTLDFSPLTASANEGTGTGSTELTFEVKLSNPVQGGFDIAYATADGTATVAAGDYIDNDGTLSFLGNAGETQTVTVLVNQDNRVELNETFQVALGLLSLVANEIAANITVDGLAETATILNDDTATVTVSAAATVTEGTGAGTTDVTFEVTLSNPVQGGFRIGYATNDGTATVANSDYVDNDGSVTFSGTAIETKTVVVQVRRDNIVERDERFTFGLTQLSEIDPTLAQSVSVNATPREVTIANDDLATVSFATATSSVAEANGMHTVDVVLNVSNAGSLSEVVVIDIATVAVGTAVTPGDFILDTTSVTFAAGSQDGARRTVALTLQEDGLTELPETIGLRLALNGQDAGGTVTTGSANHLVTVTDDPMTGAIRGIVWADTNNNGRVDDSEMMIPGVTVRLSGQDLRGQVVEISTMTDDDGSYTFDLLPGGTYRVTQVQPAAFHDGQEILGTVAGTPTGQAAADEFRGIVLAAAQQATGYNFAEVSLKAQYVTNRLFLASTPQRATMLRGFVADGEARAGNEMQSAAIRSGEAVEVRRIGSQVTVIGTSQRDVVTFTPTQASSGGEHTIVANGIRWTFAPAAVHDFVFLGAGGNDLLRLDDSAATEQLSATRDTVFITAQDYRAEATAFELVQAISDSGGPDEAMNVAAAVDYVLRLEGSWATP